MMANPIVNVISTANTDPTRIDFTGSVTGLVSNELVNLVVTAIVGAYGSNNTSVTTSIPTPPPTPPPPPPPPPTVTWSSNTPLKLSTDKLTASFASFKDLAVTTVAAIGMKYWRIKAIKGGPNFAVGLANSHAVTTTYIGGDTNSIGFYSFDPSIISTFWYNNKIIPGYTANINTTVSADGAEFRIAYNEIKNLLYVQTPAMVAVLGINAWNNKANAMDPVTGLFIDTFGIDTSAVGTGLFPAIGLADIGTSGLLETTGLTDTPNTYTLLV